MATVDLDHQSLKRSLFQMTWPMLFGVLSLMSFQLVDSAFIGQLGVDPLAALGFTVPMYQLVIGLQVGLGIATTAVIARTLGEGNRERAARLGGLVVTLGALLVALLCLGLWLFRAPIMSGLGASPQLLPLISSFWAPWLLAAWLGAMVYFGYSLSRSHGDTKLPGFLMVATSLVNIALDPLFIFVFDWGLPGAAWATVVAFGGGCLVIYPRLLRRAWLSFELQGLSLRPALSQLFGIMGPAMLSQMMPALSAMLATAIVAGFGAAAVGAWGLGTRLEFFSIVVVLALTMSVPPMVGRFLGAGQIDRIVSLVQLAVRFVLLWQLGVAAIWLLASGALSQLLSPEDSVQNILTAYLLRVPVSYTALGVCMLMVSVCNATGQPMRALLISVLRLFLCYLPLLWLGARLAGIEGLLTGVLLGNLAAGLLSWQLYRQGIKQLLRKQAQAFT